MKHFTSCLIPLVPLAPRPLLLLLLLVAFDLYLTNEMTGGMI